MARFCEICGKYSGRYPLCYSCYNITNGSDNEEDYDEYEDEYEDDYEEDECVEYDEYIENKCIICGEPSKEHYFCKTCYYKYRNKSLLLKIKNCRESEVVNASYESLYTCKDGHIVKSKSERDIDNFLYENGITHAYEKSLYIEGQKLQPDFYIPKIDTYIEHWGFDKSNQEYQQTKKFKLPLYKKARITLICTYETTDAKNMENALQRKLRSYKKGTINFLETEDYEF